MPRGRFVAHPDRRWPLPLVRRYRAPPPRSRPRSGTACRFPLLAHERGPERALGRELVVRPAQEPDAFYGGLAAPGKLPDVVVLELRLRLAAMPGLAHERASAVVALPHRALHLRGDAAPA